jgi:hypothetical protein
MPVPPVSDDPGRRSCFCRLSSRALDQTWCIPPRGQDADRLRQAGNAAHQTRFFEPSSLEFNYPGFACKSRVAQGEIGANLGEMKHACARASAATRSSSKPFAVLWKGKVA